MIEELRAFGAIRWVVAYTMEGRACYVVEGSIDDIAKFLAREEQAGFTVEEWLRDFSDADNWNRDEDSKPFRFSILIGEIGGVEVTRVTGEYHLPPENSIGTRFFTTESDGEVRALAQRLDDAGISFSIVGVKRRNDFYVQPEDVSRAAKLVDQIEGPKQ